MPDTMIHIISEENSVFNQYLAEIRDKEIQKDPIRFRKNLERMSMIIGYEISKKLDFEAKNVTTPLGTAKVNKMKEQPVIASILRAGLTMHYGLLDVFDSAENAFISAYREEEEGEELKVHVEYIACPSIEGKTVIIADPMLATGSSIELVYEALLTRGTPAKIHLCTAVSSKEGLNRVKEILPENAEIWVGAVDPELNDKSYIVPGLGDAGDLAFGIKI